MAYDTEPFFENWKKQVAASVRMMDAVVEASAKMRAAQLQAATETHERVLELQKALAEASNAQQLWNAQWNWALASYERSTAYWRSLFESMNAASSQIAHCAQEGVQGAAPPPAAEPAIPATGIPAVDNAYREMLRTSQRLLEYTVGAFGANPVKGDESKKAA